jgi:two-component system, LytTR family, response regulator
MKKYNAIIIDDESNVRKGMALLVQQNCPEIELCGLCGSAEDGRRLLKEKDINLIFLDIAMPKESGFEFIASIAKENYAIIFTTAHEEFALKAIRASAIDYLLKPISHVELKEAVRRAISYLDLRNYKDEAKKVYHDSLENLSTLIKNGSSQIKRITVIEQFGFRILEVNLIRYLEADSNYTVFHLDGLEKVVSSKSLGEFEKVLDSPLFFRIHKSSIINLDYLKSYSNFQGHFVILSDGTKLAISRRRINEFREAVGQITKSGDI